MSPERVEARLAAPDMETLRVGASKLNHPILKPMDFDPTQGLSPDEAAVVAVIANPDLRAERDRLAIADVQVLQAGILPNPQLTAGVDVPFAADPADSFTGYNVGANWDVTALIGRNARRSSARAAAQSVRLDVAWKEWQVAQAAAAAALDVIALEAQRAVAGEIDQQQHENLDVVRRAVEAHHKTIVDMAAAENAAQEARALLLTAQKDLRSARLALNRSMGFPVETQIVVRQTLPDYLEPPAVEELLEGLEARRLDLVALRMGYMSQDATLRAAVWGQFPKINFGLNTARDTSNVKTIGLGVGIDIPLFDRNQGVIAAEKATRRKLFDEYVSRVFAARWDIATSVEDIRSTNAQLRAAQEALPHLERLLQVYQAALERRNVDILSFYSVQTNLAQKRIDVIKLRQQLARNWVALEIASGEHLAGVDEAQRGPTRNEGDR